MTTEQEKQMEKQKLLANEELLKSNMFMVFTNDEKNVMNSTSILNGDAVTVSKFLIIIIEECQHALDAILIKSMEKLG